jgi:hypothetical protein
VPGAAPGRGWARSVCVIPAPEPLPELAVFGGVRNAAYLKSVSDQTNSRQCQSCTKCCTARRGTRRASAYVREGGQELLILSRPRRSITIEIPPRLRASSAAALVGVPPRGAPRAPRPGAAALPLGEQPRRRRRLGARRLPPQRARAAARLRALAMGADAEGERRDVRVRAAAAGARVVERAQREAEHLLEVELDRAWWLKGGESSSLGRPEAGSRGHGRPPRRLGGAPRRGGAAGAFRRSGQSEGGGVVRQSRRHFKQAAARALLRKVGPCSSARKRGAARTRWTTSAHAAPSVSGRHARAPALATMSSRAAICSRPSLSQRQSYPLKLEHIQRSRCAPRPPPSAPRAPPPHTISSPAWVSTWWLKGGESSTLGRPEAGS